MCCYLWLFSLYIYIYIDPLQKLYCKTFYIALTVKERASKQVIVNSLVEAYTFYQCVDIYNNVNLCNSLFGTTK